jgi:hypothetical protein
MAMLLTILGFGLFIFAIRTVNRWDGHRIPIQVHVMIGIVGVVVLLMGLYLLTAPQVLSQSHQTSACAPTRRPRPLRAHETELNPNRENEPTQLRRSGIFPRRTDVAEG